VLHAIRTFRPGVFPAVPTIYVSLLSHPLCATAGLDRVRMYHTGGAPCPVDLIERFERTAGRQLNEGYGMSESSPVICTTPQRAIRKPGTVGVPLPDTDIAIVDLETGTRHLPTGEVGELCVCGPQVMRGYWQQPDETARALRIDETGRRWLYTGDIARLDEDGFVTIVQRKKDVIIVDACNVYPSEVEAVLRAHPGIRMAAVIGVPDAYHGEVVRASIVLEPGAAIGTAAIVAHCRAQLAPYKVPAHVEIRTALPMSAVGKILYRVLRDEALSTGAH
jgi:long-chain acyl-CoA synthetase